MATGKSVERIQDVGRASGLEASLDTVRSGVFHQTIQALPEAVGYAAPVPAGLHLSCGVATLASEEPDLGGFAFSGGGLTALLCEEDAPRFETRIAAGQVRSGGYFLPPDAEHGVEQLEDIRQVLNTGSRLRATDRAPVDLIARICAPVDPWFQGAARALVMEARSLELMALTLTWLKGTGDDQSRGARQAAYARRARDILESRLDDPPTLAVLARMVGVNVRTLTAAFRRTYDASIAAYVTHRRLEVAAGLLGQGMRVSAAAFRVGYTPAHFSNAFLRHYGVRPRDAAGRGFPTA